MGMSLRMGVSGGLGGVGSGAGQAPASTAPQTATVTEQAFGPSYAGTAAGTPSLGGALTPNDPFGVTFWAGVLAIVGLALIRHSLPG